MLKNNSKILLAQNNLIQRGTEQEPLVVRIENSSSTPVLFTVYVPIAISVITVLVLAWSARRQLKNEKFKYRMELHKDYYNIHYSFRKEVEKNSENPEDYWYRHWVQIYREYQSWQERVITNEQYVKWLKYENTLYKDNFTVICGDNKLNYEEAVNKFIPNKYKNKDGKNFIRFMEEIFKETRDGDFDKIVKEHAKENRKSFWNELSF